MIFLKHMLPLLKETWFVSPHSEGSVTAAGCGSAQRAAAREECVCVEGGGSQQDSLSWSAVEIRAAKNSDLVSHTLSFKVVDLYMINYHFWQLKMHGGKKKRRILNHET